MNKYTGKSRREMRRRVEAVKKFYTRKVERKDLDDGKWTRAMGRDLIEESDE